MGGFPPLHPFQGFMTGDGGSHGHSGGLRAKHLQAYLDEFVFRFNRRRSRHAGFQSLIAIAAKRNPVTYKMLI